MPVPPNDTASVATKSKAGGSRSATARKKAASEPAAKKVAAKRVAVKKVTAKKVTAKTSKSSAGKAEAAPMAADKPRKKPKLIRDSFTMPQEDWALIGVLKARALNFKRATKKSEVLRAGLQALAGLDDKALKALLDQLVPLKVGRPKAG